MVPKNQKRYRRKFQTGPRRANIIHARDNRHSWALSAIFTIYRYLVPVPFDRFCYEILFCCKSVPILLYDISVFVFVSEYICDLLEPLLFLFTYLNVEDKRLLLADSSISSTAMTAQSAQPTVMVRNSMEQEGQFRKIYAGFVNGIAIPTEQVQHARLNDKTEMIGIANRMKSTNEKEWIEVKNKSKKVRFVKQDQFGKTK